MQKPRKSVILQHMTILYEDNHLLIVSKPHGVPSQGDETGDTCMVDIAREYIRDTYQKPGNIYVALLHRLDRPTGGILMLAKTSKAAERMSKMFQLHAIQKTYYAITENIPSPTSAELTHWLRKMPDKNQVRAYQHEVSDSKIAKLTYEVLATKGSRALVAVKPTTGRQHQIRVQMASIGCVLQGDVKYGRTTFNSDKNIALFAKEVVFEHPTTKEMMRITAPLPDTDVWQQFPAYLG